MFGGGRGSAVAGFVPQPNLRMVRWRAARAVADPVDLERASRSVHWRSPGGSPGRTLARARPGERGCAPLGRQLLKASMQRTQPDVLDGDGALCRWAELAAALGSSDVESVGGLVAGAREAVLMDEGLRRHRTSGAVWLPVVRELASGHGQAPGGQVGQPPPGQDQEAGVVGEAVQVALALVVAPGDEPVGALAHEVQAQRRQGMHEVGQRALRIDPRGRGGAWSRGWRGAGSPISPSACMGAIATRQEVSLNRPLAWHQRSARQARRERSVPVQSCSISPRINARSASQNVRAHQRWHTAARAGPPAQGASVGAGGARCRGPGLSGGGGATG